MRRSEAASRPRKSSDLGLGATLFIVFGTAGAGLGGYWLAGLMPALLSSLGGLAITVGVYVIVRGLNLHRDTQRLDTWSRLPDDPRQALVVLSTRLGGGDSRHSLTSEVLRGCEEALELASRDRLAAMHRVEELATVHPHNPVVAATKAELLLAQGDETEARAELTRALELAVAGGMGRWAVACFTKHAALQGRLELRPGTREYLEQRVTGHNVEPSSPASPDVAPPRIRAVH